MSHLSDAGRFLRGLTCLSRKVISEVTKSTDLPRRPPSIIESLSEPVSNCLNQLGDVNVANVFSKTAWKSSVLVRQTGIALKNVIQRESPQPLSTIDISNEDSIKYSPSTENNSSINNRTFNSGNEISASPQEVTLLENSLHEKKTVLATSPTNIEQNVSTASTKDEPSVSVEADENQILMPSSPTSNAEAQARPVPTTRIGRLASFGSLAAGLGVGALGSMIRRSVGIEQTSTSPYLSKANAERIVDTLCKVRGAALKLGQIISIQDNFLINEDIQKIFERVRQKADFMPEWQMNEVMTNEFGSKWRELFEEFHDRPFAAASIGQVHYGVLKSSKRRVAVKIQYPGVGKSIESDINNLVTLLNFWNIVPRGLYIENVIKVAKYELNWEVDYIREAEWYRRFKDWLIDHPMFRVPDVVENLSTKYVLTTTYFDGITLDNAVDEDQLTRDRIGTAILELCLLELFKFKAMQTDPNWSNFLFNQSNKTIGLIDFGSSRYFRQSFIDNYLKIMRASADNDPERVKELSIKAGFLTGYETREMMDAHVNAVMILGTGFRTNELFNFGSQQTTHSIHKLIPVMLKHRLTPPPEDSYSLHRKMSGAFLLCTKLRSRVHCRPLFERMWKEYNSS